MIATKRGKKNMTRKFIEPADPEFNTFKGVNPICEHNFIDLRIFFCFFPFYDFCSQKKTDYFFFEKLTLSYAIDEINKNINRICKAQFHLCFICVRQYLNKPNIGSLLGTTFSVNSTFI